MANKQAYFQGGGGVNEPTPGHKKYKVDKAIVVQPRFEEPFYRNYDLYMTEGVDGPPKLGPGAGWHHMHEYKSISDFLAAKRQYMKDKYKANDSWIEDTKPNRDERIDKMKTRAYLLSRLVKTAEKQIDENDGPNFDYGKGMYSNMDKYKSVKDFEKHVPKGTGAFFADDNEDYMMPPKEHGTSVYDWKNSPYQGKPKATKCDDNDLGTGFYENLKHYKSVRDFIEHTPLGRDHGAKIKPEWERAKDPNKSDVNHIDFPVDESIESGSILGDSESYNSPIQLGPTGGEDTTISPGQVNLGDFESYPYSAQIGGLLDKYLPQNDFEDKTPSALDFGRDYTEDAVPQGGRRYDEDPEDVPPSDIYDKLLKKYLPAPTSGLYGLPDGVDLPDEDLGDPTDINPDYGTTDVGITMYEDKWNI